MEGTQREFSVAGSWVAAGELSIRKAREGKGRELKSKKNGGNSKKEKGDRW